MKRLGIRICARGVSLIDNERVRSREAATLTEALAALPRRWREHMVPVVVDFAEALVGPPPPLVIFRIAPRAPLDEIHDRAQFAEAMVEHIGGGHSAAGVELRALDDDAVRRAAERMPPGAAVVIIATGSLVNAHHELRAAELLRTHGRAEWVVPSRSFFVTGVAAREELAVRNALLLPVAEQRAAEVTDAVRTALPLARLFVAVDEGCVPLSRFVIEPVHALARSRPSDRALVTAPLVYRRQRMVHAAHGADVERALAEDRTLAAARLMSWGASGSTVRVTESQLVGGTYGDSRLVHLQVSALADLSEDRAA